MIPFLGIASGIGAGNPGCKGGPLFLRRFPDLFGDFPHKWLAMFESKSRLVDPYDELSALYKRVSLLTHALTRSGKFFASIGGDHSCAIGTWSGVSEALRGPLGLLWIDAHMDSHTPATTESGNIHGMPLAALMGYGDPRLTEILSPRPKISPSNIALIGIRSFESGEAALLQSLGVRIYFMEEVRQRGLEAVLQEALVLVTANTVGYGISFDLDSLDPTYAQGVGTPVEGGLDLEEWNRSFSIFEEKPPLAFELVEYNPSLDPDRATARIAANILVQMCSLQSAVCI